MGVALNPHGNDDRALFAGNPMAPVNRALDRLETERTEINHECEALQRFADRVREIDLNQPASASAGVPSLSSESHSTDAMEPVRAAYRETVMAVPHYEEVYEESLPRNLATELGPDLTTAVCSGHDVSVTPHLREAIAEAAERAASRRATFLGTLDTERESLRHARRSLNQIKCAIQSRLDGDEASLSVAEVFDRLEGVTTKRQRLLHERTLPSHIEVHGLCSYLYDQMQWTYPVLAVAATLRDKFENVGLVLT